MRVSLVCLLAAICVVLIFNWRPHWPTEKLASYPHVEPEKPDLLGEHEIESQCLIPPNGFKAWNRGQLTLIYPTVKKDCSKLIAGDQEEREKVKKATEGWKSGVSYENLMEITSSCSLLRDMFNNTLYISKLELSFPIAFIFVVYESPEQFLRLLKVLYRPHNVYCIHPDNKSNYYQFFTNIAQCFPNIIIPKNIINVTRKATTILKAQMSCYSDLDYYRQQQKVEEKWRYVINLCGKELPLTSGREMVRKLISMNGTSSIALSPRSHTPNTLKRLREKTLPYNLTYYKSMTFVALSESFVHFMLTNRTAIALYDFILDTINPEEHFYATLFMAPGTPGGYNSKRNYFKVDHYFWRSTKNNTVFSRSSPVFINRAKPCFGKTVHEICIVNFEDLPQIMEASENGSTVLFHNKYFMEFDHVVMDCMEERIVDMNKREYEMECSDINHAV